jgi:hypothetical protein
MSNNATKLLQTASIGSDRRRVTKTVTTVVGGVKTVKKIVKNQKHCWNPSHIKTKQRGLIDWGLDSQTIYLCTACSDTIKQLKQTAKEHGMIRSNPHYGGRQTCAGCNFAAGQFIVIYTKKEKKEE